MSPGSNTESYPAFAHIGLRENPGKTSTRSTRVGKLVLKALKFKAFRVTVVQQMKEPDKDKRVNFCCWLLNMITYGRLDSLLFIVTDEAWFHLSGYSGVWYAVTAKRIIGPIFFDTTVNTDVYLTFLDDFYPQLTEEERNYCFFQQDGATSHTSESSLT
ncbi:hypothetical protein ANN_02983 [Periplaneta americana]|uniref:Transposase n=1 Tax=Periplaneta americana TaxID=6978 RepID=A0ABQ8U1I7_PERAM|nr:hypothetical protein ANN_02983 [Periplaneta americana]